MIYTDRLQEIALAIMSGQPLVAKNDEEREFIEKARKEIQQIKDKGLVVDMIKEWPDFD
ncbi:MAG: hypothetical protein H7A51_15465 [Akkermansiaceae bacterium]|nr:hypothetical protein [Akkermansiaceae bacterium]